jgi:hypothetical protein
MSVSVADTAPSAPVNLALVDGGDNQRVTITWSDASDNEAGFRIEHQRNVNGAWSATRVMTALPNREQQVDMPGPGVHRYRIAAANASGISDFSDWREITIAAPEVDPQSVAPLAPGGVSASDQTQRAGVVWSDASDNEQGFELERNPVFASRVLLNANVTGYIDNTGPGQFNYRVRAYNGAGYSNWTNWASVTVAETAPAARPTAPPDRVGCGPWRGSGRPGAPRGRARARPPRGRERARRRETRSPRGPGGR